MNLFRIGMALNCIGMSLDDKTYKNVKGWLDEIEREVTTDNWTMCSDEQPTNDDMYLILFRDSGSKRLWYELQEYSEGEWCINIPQCPKEHIEIVAWQNLPELPKEAE